MAFKQVLELFELLDSAYVNGAVVKNYLSEKGHGNIEVETVQGEAGKTDFIKIVIPGKTGKLAGGTSPTLGIIGRLGGLGARPAVTGFVSDGDGALAALAAAAKLLDMQERGDVLAGDVIICTHICPDAPTMPHEPVPFMGSPVDISTMNKYEVDPAMDAIISIDTTKGNRIINRRGIAISPTVKDGYILRVSEDLLDLLEIVTGELPVTFPITMQDITPYGNGLFHLNSILQPSVATTAPVVGLAITTTVAVPGCASGATHLDDVEKAAKFSIEAAKDFGAGKARFYDHDEFERMVQLYGSMSHLRGFGVHSQA